jgi:hypothetical protein
LGAILYRDRKVYAFSAQILEVTEPSSFFGHVDYKVGICMDPVDHLGGKFEWRRFDFTTRFRDLYRLHQQLQLIHKQLYLKDIFPPFSETKIFGSTDKTTIEERKQAIINFLNFVLKNDVLCKARVFQAFIEVSSKSQDSISLFFQSGREKSPEAPSTNTNEASTTQKEADKKPVDDELD